MHKDDLWSQADKRDRGKVRVDIVTEIEHAWIDDKRTRYDEDRCAVAGRLCYQRGPDVAAAAGYIFNMHLDAESLLEPWRQQAGADINRAARREWRNQPYGARGIPAWTDGRGLPVTNAGCNQRYRQPKGRIKLDQMHTQFLRGHFFEHAAFCFDGESAGDNRGKYCRAGVSFHIG